MQLRVAEIDRYGPLFDCRPPCHDGITVLSGPNEAGKTLYLEALLQLLEPDVADVMDPSPRVSQTPTGRVVVEHNDEQYECDGNTSLCDISPIEPSHLQSVFVVQDNDLKLPSDEDYYTSLIEKLGDIHTSEIESIQSALKDRGRLTDSRLAISSNQSYNNAGDVRDQAESLAADIREYIERIEAEDLEELDANRLRIKRELRKTREQLATQRTAQTVAEYDRLTDHLETYRSTSTQLAELEGFDHDTLNSLRELAREIERDREQLQELEDEIDKQEGEVTETEDSLAELEARQTELESRDSAVTQAQNALETYRDHQTETTGADRRLSLTKSAASAGLLGAGGAGAAGALTGSAPAIGLGLVLLIIALVSGGLYYRANQRLSAVETARESAIQAARDAGFDVETIDEVSPAIESFQSELSRIQTRVTETNKALEHAQDRLDEQRAEYSKIESRIHEQETELEERLEKAGVESLDVFEDRVSERDALEPEHEAAKQSLIDRFGDPDAEDPTEKAAEWESALHDLVEDIDLESVDPDIYDEDELHRLEAKVDDLETELTALQDQLDDHDDRLDEFDERARTLTTQPFVGRSLGLESRSQDGLRALAADLDTVVEQIEEDADLSRKALELFERIEEQEEQKLTDLFDPDGPASRIFEQLTGGRYTEVAYDADTHDIVVERQDDRTFHPTKLSQGTRDQLYFASRISLAHQLLGNDPGFLLLDDPFLAADPDRLREGFETLQELAADGWQILYLTAKQEVSETMVTEYELNHTELEALALSS